MTEVRVVSIEIENYKAIEHMLIEFGEKSVVVIEGYNGTGKSSAAEAVLSIFEGGHNPAVIRGYSGKDGKRGQVGLGDVPEAKRAMCKMTLSDGATIERFTTRSSSDWKITTPDGGVILDAKRTYIDALAKSFEFDPIKFCAATPDERVEWYHKVVGVSFTKAEIEAIIGAGRIRGEHPIDLQRMKQIRDGVFTTRTDINSRHRQAEQSWQKLFDSLPEEVSDESLGEKEAGLEKTIRDAEARITAAIADKKREAAELIADAQKQLSEKLMELERAYLKQCQDARDIFNVYSAEINAGVTEATQYAQEAEKQILTEAKLELGSVRNRIATARRSREARETAEQFRQEAVKLQQQADKLTEAIDALDRLRETRMAESPVAGIETGDILDSKGNPKGRDLLIHGVPWENVNTSQQLLVAMQIGLEGTGALKFLICDRGSEFDDEKLEKTAKQAAAIGIQLLITRPEPRKLTPRPVA